MEKMNAPSPKDEKVNENSKSNITDSLFGIKLINMSPSPTSVMSKSFELEKSNIDNKESLLSQAFVLVKNTMNSITDGKNPDVPLIKDVINEMVSRVMGIENVIIGLSHIRDIDKYTFYHSINVCTLSLILGKYMDLSKETLIDLGVGTILHDIGKCLVPAYVLLKPGKLTSDEFNIIKIHAKYGYDILTNTNGITQRTALIALQHHEKLDGTGYPKGLKDIEVSKLARICTIADIYDAITSDRIYKKAELPHKAIEYLLSSDPSIVDPNIMNIFINNMVIYTEGCVVLLSTGEIGYVQANNGKHLLTPKINVFAHSSNKTVSEPYWVDLSTNKDIKIVNIIS